MMVVSTTPTQTFWVPFQWHLCHLPKQIKQGHNLDEDPVIELSASLKNHQNKFIPKSETNQIVKKNLYSRRSKVEI